MAEFFKSILGEIAFLVDKYLKMTSSTMEDKKLHNLKRLLLRLRVIVEEAEGRHITNQAMGHQLNLLRKEIYRGYFVVDSLNRQGSKAKGHNVSNSFTLSKVNPAKRLFLSNVDSHREIDLQQMIDSLNKIIEDTTGIIMFIKDYPPMYRQPYSMHLFIGRSMFGRQMEMERIMDFLLQKEHRGRESIDVLPIIGPSCAGKSTLVAYVCNDARVRSNFFQIVMITIENIKNENIATLSGGGVIMHQNSSLGDDEKKLIIIELSEEVDMVAWEHLYSSSNDLISGSKMIITSRSNTIKKFGTTQALLVNVLPLEAFWYFFKISIFGSVDSTDHPELESIAMEIARDINGSFIGANITFDILRNNLVAEYWWRYFAKVRETTQKNVSFFSERPYCLLAEGKPIISQINGQDKLAVWERYRACNVQENIPVITIKDVACGSVNYEGEFDVFAWKSHIPPYNSYIVSCRIEKSK